METKKWKIFAAVMAGLNVVVAIGSMVTGQWVLGAVEIGWAATWVIVYNWVATSDYCYEFSKKMFDMAADAKKVIYDLKAKLAKLEAEKEVNESEAGAEANQPTSV